MIWGALVVAIAGCAWATIERGPFDGLTLLAGLCGVLSLGLLLLPARPRLDVGARTDTGPGAEVLVAVDEPLRPLDKDTIVDAEVDAALSTLPVSPEAYPPGSKIAQALSGPGSSFLLGGTYVSEEQRKRFWNEVQAYRQELAEWLDELDHARSERRRFFTCQARVTELGSAAADHVRLRLRFPPGFEEPLEPGRVADPPRPPKFEALPFPRISPISVTPTRPHIPASLFGRGPTYSQENGVLVIECDLGRINQSDFRDSPEFEVRAAPPGNYEVEWGVSAAGLPRPRRGRWKLSVADPELGDAITSVDEADAERERYRLD